MPVVIGGDNLSSAGGIGLTDRLNIGPLAPPVPASLCVRTKMSAHANSLQICYDQNAFELTPNNYFETFFPSVSLKVLKSELIEYLVLKSYVRFQKDVDPSVLQRAGQKG